MAKSSKRNSQGQVVELDLSGVKLGDAEIAALGQMTSLRRLTAPQTGLSDEHVGRLTSLANLTSLGLWQTQIGNDGLKIIGQLRNLSYLSVEGNRGVTDNGLAHLIGCERLSWLGLSYTGVSDNGMRHLAALSLTRLDLKGTKITNAGLQHIARIKSLRTISLANTRVTDTGVTEFQRALPNCKVEH
jgi:Leucine-rich repeat (LRR) protein